MVFILVMLVKASSHSPYFHKPTLLFTSMSSAQKADLESCHTKSPFNI